METANTTRIVVLNNGVTFTPKNPDSLTEQLQRESTDFFKRQYDVKTCERINGHRQVVHSDKSSI